MKHLLVLGAIAICCGFLAWGAIEISRSASENGLAALNRKYAGRCVSLDGGKWGEIAEIGAKTVFLVVTAPDGATDRLHVKRVPLDPYLTDCPASSGT